MRASEQEQTGGVGVNEVAAKFERIGWGPVPNTLHDLGIDLFVQARDDRLFDRGLIVGVQVKGGPSWFTEPALAEDGSLGGWWFREPDVDGADLDPGDRWEDVRAVVGGHEQVEAVVESSVDLGDLEPVAREVGLYRQKSERLGLLRWGVAGQVSLSTPRCP